MTRERLVVVGNGMACAKLLEELGAEHGFAITVVGDEPHPAYNRVLLSSVLAGEVTAAETTMQPASWYAERGIALRLGRPAVALDTDRRKIVLADGDALAFDRLVLATGAAPIRLDLPGGDLAGVMTVRTLDDVEQLRAKAAVPAVVIGGGLLGIEAAYGLARSGAKVTLVHLMDRLMERQLDAEGARLLERALAAKGIRVVLEAQTRAIHGSSQVESVELADGRRIACNVVVMAVGVQPATALAASGGLATRRGILVDDQLQTSALGIHAIGDCIEHRGVCYGLVESAYEQARIVARALLGKPVRYEASLPATNLKVSGVPVFSAGDFEGGGAEHIIVRDGVTPAYRKLVIRDGRLTGLVFVGDTHDALWYCDLIRAGSPVAGLRGSLAFGRAFAEAA